MKSFVRQADDSRRDSLSRHVLHWVFRSPLRVTLRHGDIARVLRCDARTKTIDLVRARDLKLADQHVLDEENWA